MNEAATVIHEVAHAEANIIFGTMIDDEMGDEVRVTVIAAGFERWDDAARRTTGDQRRRRSRVASSRRSTIRADVFAEEDDDDLDDGDDADEFDVPSFLK